jgi:hypothetical protein
VTTTQPEPFVPTTPGLEPPLLSGSTISYDAHRPWQVAAAPQQSQPRPAVRGGVIVAVTVVLAFFLLLAAAVTLSLQ